MQNTETMCYLYEQKGSSSFKKKHAYPAGVAEMNAFFLRGGGTQKTGTAKQTDKHTAMCIELL